MTKAKATQSQTTEGNGWFFYLLNPDSLRSDEQLDEPRNLVISPEKDIFVFRGVFTNKKQIPWTSLYSMEAIFYNGGIIIAADHRRGVVWCVDHEGTTHCLQLQEPSKFPGRNICFQMGTEFVDYWLTEEEEEPTEQPQADKVNQEDLFASAEMSDFFKQAHEKHYSGRTRKGKRAIAAQTEVSSDA